MGKKEGERGKQNTYSDAFVGRDILDSSLMCGGGSIADMVAGKLAYVRKGWKEGW